jgi:hypothetical protein
MSSSFAIRPTASRSPRWAALSALVAAIAFMPLPARAQVGSPCECPYLFSPDPGPGAKCAFSNAAPGRLRNGECMAPGCTEKPCILSGSIWAVEKFGEDCKYFAVVQDGNPLVVTTNPGISMDFIAYLECGSSTRYEIYAGDQLEVGLTLACGGCAAGGGV